MNCKVCDGKIRSHNVTGVCSRTVVCRKVGRVLRNHRYRNVNKGIPFELTAETIPLPIPDQCPWCGQYMDSMSDRTYEAQLDRKVPAMGYVPGNVHWVCRRCNREKTNLSPAEHMEYALLSLDATWTREVTEEIWLRIASIVWDAHVKAKKMVNR